MVDTNNVIQALRSRIRIPGRIENVNPFDLTITRMPANKEDILMTKTAEPVVYDFSKATDEAKTALALSYQVIKSALDVMPDEIKDFYESAQKELNLEAIIKSAQDAADKDKDGEDSDKDNDNKESEALVEIVKSALPGVFETVIAKTTEPLLAEIKKSQDRIDELESQRTRDELRQTAQTLTADGSQPSDGFVTQLALIRKSMTPEQVE